MQEEHVAVADGENEVRHTDYIYMVSDKMLVISMIAELDHHLADEMREVIDDVIDVRGVEDIIFDFSRINFMDSAGIGLIMGRYRKIHEKGRIYVAGAGEGISRILLISGLHKLVVVSSDVNDAAKKILEGKRATCYPGFESQLKGANYIDKSLVIDGNIITSKGPATAMLFSIALLEIMTNTQTAAKIAQGLLFKF